MRRHALTSALAASLIATAAHPEVQVELRPRASLMGGYDDNVKLDGSGGDGFGQLTPGLKLDVFGEHQLHLAADCQAGFARLEHPGEFGLSSVIASNESCLFNFKDRLSTRTTTAWNARVLYAQDPFAISGTGLLLRPGQDRVFFGRVAGSFERHFSLRTSVDAGLDAQALNFGPNDPGNGYLLAPHLRLVERTSERSTWDLGFREQLFFAAGVTPGANPIAIKGVAGGLVNESHGAQLGYRYALSPDAALQFRGGPVLITGNGGNAFAPTAGVTLELYRPGLGFNATVAHDLVIGPSSAGALIGDIAELGGYYELGRWSGDARFGLYRNTGVYEQGRIGSVGYGTGASLNYALTRELKLGIAALRDARITDVNATQNVDRDVVQLRLTWEKARL